MMTTRACSTFLAVLLLVSSCSGDGVTSTQVSTTAEASVERSTTSQPPSTTTTTGAESVSTTVEATSAEAGAVFDGEQCVYDGAAEFPLNTNLLLSFTNASDDTEAGYSVWKVPDGRTTDDIIEHGILGIGTHLLTDMKATSQPVPPGGEAELEVALGTPGSYAVNCFVPDGGLGVDYPAAIVEVSDG
jgi:hypothetical protein